jgi:hypothetical protein
MRTLFVGDEIADERSTARTHTHTHTHSVLCIACTQRSHSRACLQVRIDRFRPEQAQNPNTGQHLIARKQSQSHIRIVPRRQSFECDRVKNAALQAQRALATLKRHSSTSHLSCQVEAEVGDGDCDGALDNRRRQRLHRSRQTITPTHFAIDTRTPLSRWCIAGSPHRIRSSRAAPCRSWRRAA